MLRLSNINHHQHHFSSSELSSLASSKTLRRFTAEEFRVDRALERSVVRAESLEISVTVLDLALESDWRNCWTNLEVPASFLWSSVTPAFSSSASHSLEAFLTAVSHDFARESLSAKM